MIKAAVEYMQLCPIHFYQKIARKKVARVNAALYGEEQFLTLFFSFLKLSEVAGILFKILLIRYCL